MRGALATWVCCGVWAASVGLACAQTPPSPPRDASDVPGRDAILLGLARPILTAVQRQDTQHVVFHGCIDWHSAVHAHWALLRIARVTGQADEAAAWVERSLSPAGIAAEAALLRRKPRFERPYGRAWFLRLALEFEGWAHARGVPDAERLREMADEVAAGLLARYRRLGLDPLVDSYQSPAWALAQLHAWLEHRAHPGADDVERLVRTQLEGAEGLSLGLSEDRGRQRFFSRYGAWAYLVAHTQAPETVEAFLQRHPPEDLAVFEPAQDSPHHLGMVWSRAWALRALSRRAQGTRRRQLDRAYLAHVTQGLTQHARFAHDYRAYGHWVPQFAVYALTEGERPRFFH